MSQQQAHLIYITGGTGFVGTALIAAWLERAPGNTAIVQTRDPERHRRSSAFSADRVRYVRSYAEVEGPIFGLVNLAGAPIADKRWTAERKKVLEDSRVALTKDLYTQVSSSESKPETVISASAIGFYGTGSTAVDESSPAGEGYASYLCQQWEEAAMSFDGQSRLVILRLGVVLGDGGMLQKLMPLYKLGLGGPIGDGKQWLSWVHRGDVLGLILAALDNTEMAGVYNACAPEAVKQADFAKTFAEVLTRPAIIPTPAIVLKAVFGQMAQELLIEGQHVIPRRTQESDFSFRFPALKGALENVLKAN